MNPSVRPERSAGIDDRAFRLRPLRGLRSTRTETVRRGVEGHRGERFVGIFQAIAIPRVPNRSVLKAPRYEARRGSVKWPAPSGPRAIQFTMGETRDMGAPCPESPRPWTLEALAQAAWQLAPPRPDEKKNMLPEQP